jgi:ABC-type glycerol-3-phosphate transport system permease component
MFGVVNTQSPLHTVLIVPLALNEMALAIWLLTKGFRQQPSSRQQYASVDHEFEFVSSQRDSNG